MAEPTVFERPYTAAYDEAVFAFIDARPEPGPTYDEIKRLLFPEPVPRPVERQQLQGSQRPWSGIEPTGFGTAMSLPIGIALGMMF